MVMQLRYATIIFYLKFIIIQAAHQIYYENILSNYFNFFLKSVLKFQYEEHNKK